MYKMKTGNAILVAFFIWLAVEVPIKIFTLSETYFIRDFGGMGRDELMVFSFMLPFIFAILFGVYGVEKKKKDVYYKKDDAEQEVPVQKKDAVAPVVSELVPVVVEDPKKQLKEIIDLGAHVDELCKMKKGDEK